ncbi:hypothetical protein PPYR_08082 [Photinus pyralis]|uniref:Cytochrome b5 n=1 Tax=Photinus pyralis TaxID=7054 RepID=A0A1Y1MM30_PHOPY|nr:cytochrome b5-like [Photinus pyralis]KAB0797088.1 hypothetical protein PPYR_08082 [Photinus pyralis]
MVRLITRKEVEKHKNGWIIIHNSVYDMSKFIPEHPGGEEVLLELEGFDATEGFEDAGHTPDARGILAKLKVGELEKTEHTEFEAKTEDWLVYTPDPKEEEPPASENSLTVPIIIGLVAILICFFYYYYFV